jgi:C1A family cysteine protease
MFALLKALFARFFGKKVEEAIVHSVTGWIQDQVDSRDLVYTPPKLTKKAKALLPTAVDLTSKFSAIENQGRTNSCVGHATTSALEAVLKATDKSRLFVYYNARAREGATGTDRGCQLRNAMAAASTLGAAAESLWPFDPAQVLNKPPAAAYTDGLTMVPKIAAYERVTTLASLKAAITAGLPVVFGFRVYSSFYQTATTGVCTYPAAGETLLGGHAVVAVGFDDSTQMVKVRNSYGTAWGKGGYFYMPYTWFANMNNLVADAWLIRPKV